MKKLKIYLDTSVPNAYFDKTKPERQRETREFWIRLNEYQVFISEWVIKETKGTQNLERREELLQLVKSFDVLPGESDEIRELVQEYITSRAVTVVEDALHIAIASAYGMDILASWNFRHIVNLKTKRRVNAVNVLKGYRELEIADPSML